MTQYKTYKSANFNSAAAPFDARQDLVQSDNIDLASLKDEQNFTQNLNDELNYNLNKDFKNNKHYQTAPHTSDSFSKQDLKILNDKKRLNREILLFVILLATLFGIIYIFQSLIAQQNFSNL